MLLLLRSETFSGGYDLYRSS